MYAVTLLSYFSCLRKCRKQRYCRFTLATAGLLVLVSCLSLYTGGATDLQRSALRYRQTTSIQQPSRWWWW